MELRRVFDEDVAAYDRWRPRYCPRLFADLADYAGVGPGSAAIEVGCGTGQATGPMLAAGCRVTAVELGPEMAAFVGRQFGDNPGFAVVNTSFEEFDAPEGQADLLYSATAFHWVSPETGYPKAFRFLRPGGTLALFWNRARVDLPEDPLHQELREVYRLHRPGEERAPIEHDEEHRVSTITGDILRYGFVEVERRVYRGVRTMGPQEYVGLLNTYSDHRALPTQQRLGLEQAVAAAILRHDGTLKIHDVMDLYLARKP